MMTISIGSLVGSLLLIKVINYIPRRSMLAWSFTGLGVLLVITGGAFYAVHETAMHALIIAFYVFCQLLFNLGPNTLIFIMPAEIFPTRYRATCHGISAAAGKLGSVLAQVFVRYVSFKDRSGNWYTVDSINSTGLGWVLIIFGGLCSFGAYLAWIWIPEVQHLQRGERGELPSKSLEELAVGRAGRLQDDDREQKRRRRFKFWQSQRFGI